MVKKSLFYLFLGVLFVYTPMHGYFDFGMQADEAQKKLSEYYQTILTKTIPADQLEELKSGKGYLTLATDWFKSFVRKPSHNKMTQDEINTILSALTQRLAIYNFLFNQYNALVNPSNLLQQTANLDDKSIRDTLNTWTNQNFIKTLVKTDKNNKINGNYLNNYFNLIVNTFDAGLEPDFKKKSPEEILINLAKQWSKLPKENSLKLLEQLAKNNENSLIKRLCQNITPAGVYELIKNGFNKHQKNPEKQAPYIFLAKLVDTVFKKPKQQSLRIEVANYLNPSNGPQRTYADLLAEMEKNPEFFYTTFGTTSNASAIKEWMDEARKGKKTNDMIEDRYGRLVPKREQPNPELYTFLEKIIEYNPLLYVGDNSILRISYPDAEDRVKTLADAFNSIS